MKLKRGDLVKIKFKGTKHFDHEAVIESIIGDEYTVILAKDPFTLLTPLRDHELEFISSGHQQVIEQRDAEIEGLKEIERLKRLAYLPVDPDSVIHPIKDGEGRIKS